MIQWLRLQASSAGGLDLTPAQGTKILSISWQSQEKKKMVLASSCYELIVDSQFSSVAQSHPTLCDPMDCSMSGLPVHHQLLELTQTHAHRVGDAIQPCHPLSSSVVPNPSCPQSLPASGSFPISQLFT